MVEMGIVSTGTWFPETYMTSEDIAAESGLPGWVVREKLGIERKFVADPDVHPNEMAVKAARVAIDKAGIDPMDIDVVLCTTEEWREYLLWTTAIDLAWEVGAKRAWGLDIHARCVTTIAALKLARSLMADDPSIDTILIGGGYAISHFIDLGDVNTSFLFNIGAGAGAMIVKRDWPENRVLGNHLIADGMMSRHVLVPASGSVRHPDNEALARGDFKFRLVEPEAMKQRLGEVSIPNWLACVDKALENSGTKRDGSPYTRDDIDFFNMSLVKPSAHREMLERLGMNEEQSVYISDIGHIGEQDAIINIEAGIEQGRLKAGDTMVIIAAGIGYVWGGAVVEWGPKA
ncbi:MAG: 3-oxoacyl-ACP synthase [Xanthomonadales bacterium]|nr:3-oxoacyl-ACP synthase [Gammaproteobacteria bacterium]MBT8049609.1 3-oxoacyl-ACP synthase [Gammaproteobacteria bacterium]NNL05991.1 3-oxoacyl-ACP synthase [Xanthomonadales bacterium]